MEPYIKNIKKAMGGTKDAYENFSLPRRCKKEWAERKRQSRREKRRIDKQKLEENKYEL